MSVANQGRAHVAPDDPAIFVDIAFLHSERLRLAADDPLYATDVQFQVVRMCNLDETTTDQLGFGETEHPAQGRINPQESVVWGGQSHGNSTTLKCCAEPLLAFPQSIFRLLELGDVTYNRYRPNNITIGILNWSRTDLSISRLTMYGSSNHLYLIPYHFAFECSQRRRLLNRAWGSVRTIYFKALCELFHIDFACGVQPEFSEGR